MLKRIVYMRGMSFKVSYHPRTGFVYISTSYRHQKELSGFFEFIQPTHFHVNEWIENVGRGRVAKAVNNVVDDYTGNVPSVDELFGRYSRVEYHGDIPVVFRKTGPHVKLIYRTSIGEVLKGLRNIVDLGWSVTEV